MVLDIDPREIIAAAPDGLSLKMGLPVRNPHPFAHDVGFANLAYARGALARKHPAGTSDLAIMGFGLGTSDYSRELAHVAQHIVTRAFSAQAEHTAFCTVLDVRDFQPADLPGLDVEVALEEVKEFGQLRWGLALAIAGARQVRLATWAKAIGFSRELLINDQHSIFLRMSQALGAAGARTQARLVCEALEANQVLDDDAPVFDLAFDNVEEGALAAPTLGSAMSKLRTQVLPNGQRADLSARHLLVAPELEYGARQLVLDAGLDVQVHALANLPAGRWFLLSDPAIQPTIATLRLMGTTQTVRMEQMRRPFGFDGTAVKAVADLGATLLGRHGIVRGGA